jgi:hypothetical protein
MLDTFPISEMGRLLQRFPKIELSYETISHKKVLPAYDVAIAIPHGKKYFAWFSFHGPKNVVYFLELNKERKIVKIQMREHHLGAKISCDTVVYGVLLAETENNWKFVVEDMLMSQGFTMKNATFKEKIPWIYEFLEKTHGMGFYLPALWHHMEDPVPPLKDENAVHVPEAYRDLPYAIHHIQYRAFAQNLPLINVPYNSFATVRKIATDTHAPARPNGALTAMKTARIDLSKPQYKFRTIFQVSADIQYDIYHLYAYSKQNATVYYNVAYIPNYKTSVMMNRLFRNIRENENLDAIEESDDEDDFQNVREDKYVDLEKTLLIECQFHPKFRRWVPLRVVKPPCKVVHISQL